MTITQTQTPAETYTVAKTGEVIPMTAAAGKRGVAILERLAVIAAAEKVARDLEDEKDDLKAELETITGGAKHATFHGATVATRMDSHSQKVNLDLLLEGWPEAHAAVVSKVPYHYYRRA